MNIKVITRHGPSNYGSLLQSMATLSVLRSLGHHAEIIDYQRSDERGLKGTLALLAQKPAYNRNLIKKLLYVLVRFPLETLARHKFDKMRNHYLSLTPRCTTPDDLRQLRADVFMTGSDQVWGPLYNGQYDPAYFLQFTFSGRRCAYAASFGKTRFSDDIVRQYQQMLSQYDAIAVREDSAVQMLHDWHIDCLGQVLDPTLMLTAREWSEYIRHPQNGQYVLVYQIHNDSNLNTYAQAFARHVGLPLIRVSAHLHQCRRGGKFIWRPDVADFLAYIQGCAYLITDSFHGTCFAINFNKQFLEVLPNTKTGSRNQSILTLTGLTDRIVTDFTDFSLADIPIDYAPVNPLLDAERLRSRKILQAVLGDSGQDCPHR